MKSTTEQFGGLGTSMSRIINQVSHRMARYDVSRTIEGEGYHKTPQIFASLEQTFNQPQLGCTYT